MCYSWIAPWERLLNCAYNLTGGRRGDTAVAQVNVDKRLPSKVMTMKAVSRILTAGLVLVLLAAPLAVMSEQMLVPVEKKIQAGTTVVSYGGQSLRFTTPVALVAKFDPVNSVDFRLTVHVYGDPGPSAMSGEFELVWEDFQKEVYNGPPPPPGDPFSEIFLSESGFTEK